MVYRHLKGSNLVALLFSLGDLGDDILDRGIFFLLPLLKVNSTYVSAVIQYSGTKTGHCISLTAVWTQYPLNQGIWGLEGI